MSMTKREQAAKTQITNILQKEGHVTYARLFELFDLNLTKDPEVVGYMEPGKARIVVNEGLSIDQVSFVVRHEILHEYLDHQLRMRAHMGDDAYDKRNPSIHQIINMAADYEISNRGYTKADKKTAKRLMLNDREVQGLVTELDHPEWAQNIFGKKINKLTLEEMFDLLMKEYNDKKDEFEKMLQQMADAGLLDIGSGAGSAQQEMEDIEREAQAAAEAAAEAGDKQGEKTGNQIAQAANKAADDAEEQKEKDKADGKVFKSEDEQKKAEELAKRVEAIKKAFKNAAKAGIIDKEKEDSDAKAELIQAARDEEKYRNDPLQKFRLSLKQFVEKETAVGRGPTWTRFNKKYSNTGLIKPGSSRLRQNYVPLINVYFDRSGSWTDKKTAVGERAMAFLYDYQRRGKVKIDLYYFAVNVHGGKTGRAEAEKEGGTAGEPVLKHIERSKPDNVIIMTDDDIEDCRTDVTIPGAVYFLFKGGRSPNLMEHIRGKKLTKDFDI